MMIKLIQKIKQQGCSIWLEGGELKLSFSGTAPDSAFLAELKAAKKSLIQILRVNAIGSKAQFNQRKIFKVEHVDYPLSFVQERMLFIERFEEGTDAYHIPYVARLDGQVDIDKLVSAVNQVVNRHSALKTVFVSDKNGNEYQQILNTDIVLRTTQLAGEAELAVQLKADIATVFDLTAEAPFRMHHYRVKEQGEESQYLLFLWHHIAFDGWSTDLFLQELSEAYQAQLEQREAVLPPLDISYGDYSVWQREYLQGEAGEEQLAYWERNLSGVETPGLPIDKPRPDQIDHTGRDLTFKLNSELSCQLRELAKARETTLYTVLLGAFYTTLAKLSGQSDILVGTPTDNRHHTQVQPLIGMFVNSLALRAQVEPSSSIEALIQQSHQVVAQAKAHQDIPFEQVVDRLDVERDSSRHPLFQVMFGVQNFGEGLEENSSLPFTSTKLEETVYSPAKFDLSVFLSEAQEGISGCINFATSLFNDTTIERMAGIYQRVLEAFVVNPGQTLAEIEVLSDQERQTLLQTWNQTDADYPQDKTLQQLFEAQVEKTPNNIALVFDNEELTYRELNSRANQLAHALRAQYQKQHNQPLQPDTLIALYLDRSLEMVISILAVLKAGGAYVPVSPEYPAERTRFILEDTQAPFILTQKHYFGALNQCINGLGSQSVMMVVDDERTTEGEVTSNPSTASCATDLAYVIYTSGTTGKPKGVQLAHFSVVNRIHWMQSQYPLCENDKVLQKTPYTFDVSVWELLWANWVGASIIMAPPEVHKQPEKLVQLMQEKNVTVLHFVPSMLSAFCHYLKESNRTLPASVRQLFCSGEAITPPHLAGFSAISDASCKLTNLYGPTEAAIDVTYFDTNPQTVEGVTVPIGCAIDNTRLYVLDNQLQLIPMGTPGELYIGGAGLARGYLNRPELTAERFIPNPFMTEQDQALGYDRLYKTGDLVRWLPDGNLEYLGRNDFQVKIRGYRIEPGEIETALAAILSVKQAVVIDHERDGNKSLAAYIVPAKGAGFEEDLLREQLAARLPDYMVPSTFTELDSIPLTINGKLDRRALPEPSRVSVDSYIAPRTEQEARLCAIWQEVLGLEQIGVHDNFFRIGGDSIVSIQLVSKLRQAGYQLQVKAIFDAPTVAQLAQWLSQNTASVEVVAEQGRLQGEFDLLPTGQWFFDRQWAKPHHWNQAFMIRLPGHITARAIETALIHLAECHDVLRSNFVSTEAGYRQCYQDAVSPWMAPLQQQDIRVLNQEALQGLLTEWQSGFNYHQGPLWQAGHLTGYEDGSARLFLAFHHLIMDAVSWRIIAEDMKLLLTGQPLPAKTSSYRQWAGAVQAYAQSHQEEVSYWQGILDGVSSHGTLAPVSHQTVVLSPALTSVLLQEANRGFNTDINDLLLSALAMALAEALGTSDTAITLEGHGRELIDERLDVSRTVGWFTTMYPVNLRSLDSVDDTIIHTRENLRRVPNKGLGFGALQQTGRLSHELPAVSFNYLGQLGSETTAADWQITGDASGEMIAVANRDALLLNINGAVQSGVLSFTVVSRLPEAPTQTFTRAFEAALATVIETAQQAAQSGGVSTPGDYPVTGLSVERLQRLQQTQTIEALYPASSLQQGFIYHHLSQSRDDAYRVQLLLDYHTELDVEAYQRAWALASLRFPALRTCFDWDGEILQVITAGESIDQAQFRVEDLRHLTAEERESAMTELQQRDRSLPFDLSQPGLVRFTLMKQQDGLTTVLFSNHHSILDGWSLPVLLQAVHEHYDSLIQGKQPVLTVDTAYRASRDYLAGQQDSTQAHWATRKAGFTGTNDLRNLLSRPVDLSRVKAVAQPEKESLTITDDTYRQLKTLCRQQGVTLNVVLQFAWHKLLHTYCGDDQTIVGTTVAGRDIPVTDVASSVGLYINTLPLAVDWDADVRVSDMLQQIQQSIAELNSHSDVSLASLQPTGERLFHSLLVFENYPAAKEAEAGSLGATVVFRDAIEKVDYPLSVIAFEKTSELQVKLNYGKEWLDKEQAQRLLLQLLQILTAIATNPAQPHQSISLMREEERQTLLQSWNQTDADYPQDKTLQQLFEAQVEKTPDNIALVFDNEKLTYRELNARANQLAHTLRAQYQEQHGQPLQPDTLTGLYLDRSLEMVISILAVLKAGGAYVPVSPEYPTERTRFILEDTRAPFILTQERHLGALDRSITRLSHHPMMLVVDDQQMIEGMTTSNLQPVSCATDLAYVIYTSGTTGKPKGVMVEQAGVVNLTQFIIKTHLLDEQVNALFFSNYVFDASIFEIFPTLAAGSSLYVVSSSQRKDSEQLLNLINASHITKAFLPTAIVNQLWDELAHSSLEVVHTGGETLLPLNEKPSNRMFNQYGPTEGTVCVTQNQVSDRYDTGIGRPIDNVRLYVLDNQMQLVPVGAPGELYIGGAGLARGYLNRPELTTERFIPNPFMTAKDQAPGYNRLYKTGDLVRWLPDGNLEYLGRNDFQVKIRGYRIELGEIEAALTAIPSVKQVVVIDHEREGNKSLAAYIVPADDVSFDESNLREQLAASMPEYMIPGIFIALASIPLTINGKLDRRALPEPEYVNSNSYVAPRNELEARLCAVWQDVLGLEKVGINDNFFHIGGNSIAAIKLTAAMKQRTELEVELAMLFSHPTIESIASEADDMDRSNTLLKPLTPRSQAKQKLFMVHASRCGCEVYSELANTLASSFNCIGVDNYNYYAEQPSGSLREVASSYFDLIVAEHEPGQPFYLLGWSLGGQLCMEIAWMLEQEGIRDIHLYLLDTVIKVPELRALLDEWSEEQQQQYFRDNMRAKGVDETCINKALQAYPYELAMDRSSVSGPLEHTQVTLFKAGLFLEEEADARSQEIISILRQAKDNFLGPLLDQPLQKVLLGGRHHDDILEATREIAEYVEPAGQHLVSV